MVSPRHQANSLLLCLLSTLTVGCMVGPDYVQPDLPFELNSYVATTETGNQHDGSAIRTDPERAFDDAHSWWANLNDPMLVQLLARACADNPGLLEAAARIQEANARSDVATAAFWPQATHSSGYSRRRIAPGDSGQVGRRSGDPFDAHTFDIRASWEVDLFGRLRRGIEAAEARAVAQTENRRDVLLSLMADVATNYVDLRVLQHRLSIANSNLDVQRRNMHLAKTRHEAGLVGMLDVKQAETVVRTTEASVPRLEEQIRLRLYRLAVLTGQPPSGEFVTEVGTGPIPVPKFGIHPGIPAHMVSQRPDIRRAEAELHAATADIGRAEGELYPQVTLVGNPSFDTSVLGDLYRNQSFGYSLGPSLRWNIITMGRTRANIVATEAAAEQAELRFRSAVLSALEEVEAGAISYRKAHERVEALTQATAAARESVQLSESTYQVGNSSFQRVVDAQRQLLRSQDQLAAAYGEAVVAWIRTYRALGGGWRHSPEPEYEPQLTTGGQPVPPRSAFSYDGSFAGFQGPWKSHGYTNSHPAPRVSVVPPDGTAPIAGDGPGSGLRLP